MVDETLDFVPLSLRSLTQTYLVRLWVDPAGWRMMVQHIPTDQQFFFTDSEQFFYFWAHQLEKCNLTTGNDA